LASSSVALVVIVSGSKYSLHMPPAAADPCWVADYGYSYGLDCVFIPALHSLAHWYY